MKLTPAQQAIQDHLQYLCDACIETANLDIPPLTVKLSGENAARAKLSQNIITYPLKWVYEYNITRNGFLVIIAHEVTHFIITSPGHPHAFRAAETLLLHKFGIRPIYYHNYRYALVYSDLKGQIICGSIGQDISSRIASKSLLLF